MLEHNPIAGEVKLFNKDGTIVGNVQLNADDRAFTTIDPKAEKYYNISPYAYCANNPIRFIDPNGEDVWEMDYQGRVIWIEKSDEHTLYALNNDGVRTGKSITISDRSIFDNLASTGRISNYTASYTTGSPSELAQMFLFGADNSNVEWRLSRYDNNGENAYALGSVHKDDLAISMKKMGLNPESEIAFIHSHPSTAPSKVAEQESMGWRKWSNNEADFMGRPRGTIELTGDSRNVFNGRNSNYYTYFPNSGSIYQVRGIPEPALIRNIKNHNNNPKKLFWGVLNGR